MHQNIILFMFDLCRECWPNTLSGERRRLGSMLFRPGRGQDIQRYVARNLYTARTNPGDR